MIKDLVAFISITLRTIVRGEDNNRIIRLSALLECLENLATGIIGFIDEIAIRSGSRLTVEFIVGNNRGMGRGKGKIE